MPYTLKSTEILVCGETLTIYQASNEMDITRAMLIGEAELAEPATTEDTRGQYLHYMSTLLYPSLVACTKGNIPTRDEFLYGMPTADSDLWIKEARVLNPQWFTFVGEQTEVEKKEE